MDTIWPFAPLEFEGRESLPKHRVIVEALALDIERGGLPPSTKLPTMRNLAEELGVTVGTVLRAYELAEKQGLVVRRKGSGTFVREEASEQSHQGGPVDLSRNEPPIIDLDGLLKRSLEEMSRDRTLSGLLSEAESQGARRHREVLASWLMERGLTIDPNLLIVTNGAQQALTIAVGALTRSGDQLLVEQYTYPGVKDLARFFGLRLVPVAMDAEGMIPEALAEAAEDPRARLLYTMPTAQNPTTTTLSSKRREKIVEIAERARINIIEDDVGFKPENSDVVPLAALAPERTIYVTSFSKMVAPGFRVGMIGAPGAMFGDLLAASQTASWMAAPLMTELACAWIKDGTLRELALGQERALAHQHRIARDALSGLDFVGDERNPHLWLRLQAPWTGEELAQKLERRGVQVAPGEWFAIDSNPEPGVRLSIANIPDETLRAALAKIVDVAETPPGPIGFRA